MKKIFYSLLALAAIASCAKTEAVYMEDNSEIKIKPTTALATKANHLAAIDGTEYPVAENFDVYGYWADVPAGSLFTNETEEVTTYLGEGGAVEFTNKGVYWGGTTTYYWPKNGSLRFAAYSPSNVNMTHDLDTDTYTVENYEHPTTTATTWDLLVAPTSPSYTAMTAAENVSVVFEHALSWITVKVVAKDADAAKAFDIKKVTINDVNSIATLNAAMADGIQVDEWTGHKNAVDYVVYEGSPQTVTETPTVIETTTDGTVVIPQATTSITIDYTQNALEGTPALDNQSVTVDLVLDAEDSPWEPGKHYVYTLVFGLDEILINPDVVDWDDVVVNEIEVGKTNVYSAEQLAEALRADEENIEVVLVNDIDLPISSLGQQTGGSGEYKLGGVNTKNITIDLNGKTLNVTTTYWSNLGAKNNDAVITIKNGTMTSSQASGTWNSYDLCFSNCNYVIEDVVFEKAVAFEGKNYTLKNVTINETHDYYAMWISAKGQNVTIDGLTVNSDGRGIKIDEQYVSAPAHVTLNVANATFNTVKKAAIVVKSVAGATVNLENVDITNVAADNVFPVWVDSNSAAYADKVVVNGGLGKVEGGNTVLGSETEALVLVSTVDELNNLKATNAYVILTADIDFQGAAMAKPIEIWKNSTFDGNGHKISNVTTAVQGGYATSLFRGDANSGDKVVKNLVIENLTTPAGYSYASAIWSDLQGANIEIDNVTINNATIDAKGTIGGFVGFVSAGSTSVVIKNSSINNSTLNGGEAEHKRGAVVGRAYGCTVTCDNVVVNNVNINGAAATTSTLVGDKGYTGTVTVK